MARADWVHEVATEEAVRGERHFAYDVWASATAKAAGDRPILRNRHRAQHRTDHQRIVRPTRDTFRHQSGLAVPIDIMVDPLELTRFLRANGDPDRTPTRFRFRGGDITDEWQHELHTLTLVEQREPAIEAFLDRVALRPALLAKFATQTVDPITLNLQVAAGADDAEELDNSTGFDGTSVSNLFSGHTTDAAQRSHVGERFNSVTIPQVARIDTATTQQNILTASFDDADGAIHCEDVDDSASFVATADVTSRVRTTANTAWTANALGTGFVVSPDITTAVQEVIDRASWADGNDLTVLLIGGSGADELCFIQTFEAGSALAAKLDIDYSVDGPLIGGKLTGGGILAGRLTA